MSITSDAKKQRKSVVISCPTIGCGEVFFALEREVTRYILAKKCKKCRKPLITIFRNIRGTGRGFLHYICPVHGEWRRFKLFSARFHCPRCRKDVSIHPFSFLDANSYEPEKNSYC